MKSRGAKPQRGALAQVLMGSYKLKRTNAALLPKVRPKVLKREVRDRKECSRRGRGEQESNAMPIASHGTDTSQKLGQSGTDAPLRYALGTFSGIGFCTHDQNLFQSVHRYFLCKMKMNIVAVTNHETSIPTGRYSLF